MRRTAHASTATGEVARFGPFEDFIVNGVRVGDALCLSGRVSLDDPGNFVGAYASGATRDVVVEERGLVTDIRTTMTNIEDLFKIRRPTGKRPGLRRRRCRSPGR
jgi:hypothetical protein